MNQTPWRTQQTFHQTTSPSKEKQRTGTQNKSMHAYFKMKADQLNDLGLDMKTVLALEVRVEWTPASFKEYFKAMAKKMLEKSSTTELSTKEVNQVYLNIEKNLAEQLYAEIIPFPTNEPEMKA